MDLGELASGAVSARAREQASKMRDDIAQAMWDQYVSISGDGEEDT